MKNWQRVLIVFGLVVMTDVVSTQISIESTINPGPNRSIGEISVVADGTAKPFRVELHHRDQIIQITPLEFVSGAITFSNLSQGDYLIKVYDRNDCETILGPITLSEEFNCDIVVTPIEFRHTTGSFNGACPLEDDFEDIVFEDGVVEINISSRDPYTISWIGPGGFASSDLRIENLRSGVYKLTVTNSVDVSCVYTQDFEVYYCNIRYAYCYYSLDLLEGSDYSVELIEKVSPSDGLDNGVLHVRDESLALRYEYYWSDESGEVYNSALIDNLAPGIYTFHIVTGCGPEITEDFELVDCTLNPLQVVRQNECPDPRYTNFPIEVTGGVNPQRFGPEDIGGQFKYTVIDDRGCKEELIVPYGDIGTWDYEVEVLRPRSPSSFAQIEVTLDGIDESHAPFTLGINGIEYNLEDLSGANTIWVDAREGVNQLLVYSNIGCEIVKEIDFGSCMTLSQELSVSTGVSYDGVTGDVVPIDRRTECNDNSYLSLSLYGGLSPYEVVIRSEDDIWSFTDQLESGDHLINSPLPQSSVIVEVVDECGNIFHDEIIHCNYCDLEYAQSEQSFFIGENRGIEFSLDCPCGCNIVDFNGADLDLIYRSHLIEDWELPYTITWPEITGLGETVLFLKSDGTIGRNGPDHADYDFDYPEEFYVTITRGDGCVIEVPVIFSTEESTSISYITGQSSSVLAYEGIASCVRCDATDDETLIDIDSNSNCEGGDVHYFEFYPLDPDNPCYGGGTLRTREWDVDQNKFVIHNITVSANDVIGSILEYGRELAPRPSGSPITDVCERGGSCLFDSDLINDLDSNSPIAGFWCSSFIDPFEDPCSGVPDCGDGMVCDGGECVPYCQVNFCESDICNFIGDSQNGGGLRETIYIEHDLPDGTALKFNYNTFSLPEAFEITNIKGGKRTIDCVATESLEFIFINVIEGLPVVVFVDGVSCHTGSRNWYFDFECVSNG